MLTVCIVSLDLLILLSSSEAISHNQIADLFPPLLSSTLFPLHRNSARWKNNFTFIMTDMRSTMMLAELSQSPFLHNFDPDIDHPTHLIITCTQIPHLSLLFVLDSGLTAPASMLCSAKGEWCPAPPVRIVADLIQSFMFFFSADNMHKHEIDSSMASATSHLMMRSLRSVSEGH